MYPCLNQVEWVSHIANSQQKFYSLVQWKNINTYGNYKKNLWVWFRNRNNRIFKIDCNRIIGRNFGQAALFLNKKIIPSRANPWTVKKIISSNLLVEVKKKNAENWSKWNFIQKLICMKNLIPQRDLSVTELSLATAEEIKATLGKQGVTNYKRITIRRDIE